MSLLKETPANLPYICIHDPKWVVDDPLFYHGSCLSSLHKKIDHGGNDIGIGFHPTHAGHYRHDNDMCKANKWCCYCFDLMLWLPLLYKPMSFETKQHFWFLTHRIQVCYICLHVVDFYGFHVGKYTSPMDGMGHQPYGDFTHHRTPVSRQGSLNCIWFYGSTSSAIDVQAWTRKHTKRFEPRNSFMQKKNKSNQGDQKFPLIMNPMFFCEWFFSFNGVSTPILFPSNNGQTAKRPNFPWPRLGQRHMAASMGLIRMPGRVYVWYVHTFIAHFHC